MRPIILVVDDQPNNINLLLAFLKQHDFETRVADSGERALTMLEKFTPDLILLDVMMPVMDGFELCRLLKADDKSAEIPIIFMTALDSTRDKVAGFEAGGVDYITKPFNQAEVLARINTHLTLRKRTKELEKALSEVRTLQGILPICMHCKKIRDDQGYWQQVEAYITKHSDAEFSHGLCHDCYDKEMAKLREWE